MKPKNESIRLNFSLDEETYQELKKQMRDNFRKNRSDYLRYLIWKENKEHK